MADDNDHASSACDSGTSGPVEDENSSTGLIPEGTVLDKTFRICGRSSSGNHTNVYRVCRLDEPATETTTEYEARAYNLQNLSPPHKQYRIRAMARLSKRAILRASWGDLQVVVYKTGQLNTISEAVLDEQGTDQVATPTDVISNSLSTNNVGVKRKPKTNYQRESQRLRQRDRRRANRLRKKDPDPNEEVGTELKADKSYTSPTA